MVQWPLGKSIVLDPGAARGFLYTYGAEPEFFIRDVPRERVPEAQAMLNYLVERTRSRHPSRSTYSASGARPPRFSQAVTHVSDTT